MIYDKRPNERKNTRIDSDNFECCIISDLRNLNTNSNNNTIYSIEIKPKFFSVEECPKIISKELLERYQKLFPNQYNQLVNQQISEFKLRQVDKLINNKSKRLSCYDPRMLFSGDIMNIYFALQCMQSEPQNNFTIFKDNKKILNVSDGVLWVLSNILFQSKVLDSIKNLQLITKSTAESIYPISNSFKSEEILSKSINCLQKLIEKNLLDEEDKKIKEIILYLISKSSRDCSIIISFTRSDISLPESSEEKKLIIDNNSYIYKIGIIDLDTKYVGKIPFYYEDQVKIFEEYLNFSIKDI